MTAGAQTIWLARHAERLDFIDPQWASHARRPHDPPLSPCGRRQARLLASRLRHEEICHLLSSPFLRTLETSAPVAEVTGLPIKIEPGLSEWLNRKWFPTPPEIVVPGELRIHPARIDPSYRSLGAARHGESGLEALRRSGATTLRLVEELTGNLLLVGHRASMLGATLALLGISQAKLLRLHPVFDDIPPAFLVALDRTRTGWTLRLEP